MPLGVATIVAMLTKSVSEPPQGTGGNLGHEPIGTCPYCVRAQLFETKVYELFTSSANAKEREVIR